jgi:type 1 fimbria pilin
MRMIAKVVAVVCAVVLAMAGMAKYAGASDSGAVTVKGYVLDSACAFTKDLKKPISKECAVACAKAGSALVILAEDGTIYWPIADTTPSSGQNTKLLPFAGEKVTASGKVYDRGGSKALVIVKIEAQK